MRDDPIVLGLIAALGLLLVLGAAALLFIYWFPPPMRGL